MIIPGLSNLHQFGPSPKTCNTPWRIYQVSYVLSLWNKIYIFLFFVYCNNGTRQRTIKGMCRTCTNLVNWKWLKHCSHVTYAFASNVKNGVYDYGNKWWCPHLTFPFPRREWYWLKKNADADVTCECTFKPTFVVKVKREVKSCPSCNQTGMSNRWTKAAVLRSQHTILETNTTLILEKVPIFLAWGHKGRSSCNWTAPLNSGDIRAWNVENSANKNDLEDLLSPTGQELGSSKFKWYFCIQLVAWSHC